MKSVPHQKSDRYFAAFRKHYGVFVDVVLVDCSVNERDVELRSCSLCVVRALRVTMRLCRPFTDTQGVKLWRLDDLIVSHNDNTTEAPSRSNASGVVWPWSLFRGKHDS